MPESKNYVDPNDGTRADQLYSMNTERRELQEGFDKAYKYYLGDQAKQLKIKHGEPDDNVIINLVQITCDRTVSFLFPEMPVFELDPQEAEETENERWLKEAFLYNGGLGFLQRAGLIGYLSGHVYVRVKPAVDKEHFPKLLVYPAGKMISYWEGEDYSNVLWHELRWKQGDVDYLIDFINNNGSWEIVQYKRENTTAWKVDVKGQWNYEYGPIVHWQHLPNPVGFYGLKEAKDLALQDTVNLIVGELGKIIRYHSSPRTIAIGVPANEIQETAIDSMWAIENEAARVQNLEMQSELNATRELVTYLQDSYLALRRVVILKGEVKDFQRVTNTGVRTVFMDALAKRNVLMKQYGIGLANIANRMLTISNRGSEVPTIHYVDPLPIDSREQIELEIMKETAKFQSKETSAMNIGNSWEDELDKMAVESEIDFLKVNTNSVDNTE